MTNEKNIPLAYIMTCRTYATWLHGDERTSVDRHHNIFLTPRIKHNPMRHNAMKNLCSETPFLLNESQRDVVLQSIIDTCAFSHWHLHAAHVRSNYLHIVVQAEKAPERVAISFKANATRYLKELNPELNRKKFWSKGQSVAHIFQSENLLRAIQYTAEEQGKKMACYCEPGYYKLIDKPKNVQV